MPSIAVLSIPAVWGIGLLSHFATIFLKLGWRQWDNANVRKDLSQLKLSTAQAQLIGRLDAAHYNAQEILPLWAAAILYALHIGAPKDELDQISTVFLASRVLYTLVYAWANTQTKSLVRSAVWLGTSWIPVYIFFKY
ncbi:hypothetical protein M427DRAFT_54073 [Gonapodya prolifera JEL478]|uniref:Uncharacterized protein n=1 Tax=Gonapodya prolifera (strain JEL478) TaxID=1344416 RepID=A0A139ANF8_GONPJ|nr:hypothetical protein M427DRAFT_54073 [Gonapodya prolifera JEL478]|eukprot:KXS18272.1 hypothetical protein M427DRAFT_54073 [Gonapodya prolifera JEL478]